MLTSNQIKIQLLNDLRAVELALSPENLTCDGELPRWAVKSKYNRLIKSKKQLIKQLGYEPTEAELYPSHIA